MRPIPIRVAAVPHDTPDLGALVVDGVGIVEVAFVGVECGCLALAPTPSNGGGAAIILDCHRPSSMGRFSV
jgi:hypothetical protein